MTTPQMISLKLDCAQQEEVKTQLSNFHDPKEVEIEITWVKQCGDAVWKKYRELNSNASDNDIVAGFIVKRVDASPGLLSLPRVVAIGSGTKCVGGDQLRCDGTVVHDLHAEVVARRSLLRWLYSQLQMAGSANSIAVHNKIPGEKPFKLLPFELWLYTSQTPCGDSAVYSRQQPSVSLCWNGNHSGNFRFKIEAGQGSVLAPEESVRTFDGLKLGDRSMHHSCSDKIAKWSVLGVQGALISRLVDPIYIAGVIVGNIFSHGHLCRALCCRSDFALKVSGVILQPPYAVKHPKIRHAPLCTSRSKQIKRRSKMSYNWAEHDERNVETVDGVTGEMGNGQQSRICKRELFKCFSSLDGSTPTTSYSENKSSAVLYQTSKKAWKESMNVMFGAWMSKPQEVDDFLL